MKSACAVAAGLLLAAAGGVAAPLPAVRDGDIIFHTSRSSQSAAIQRATGSRYSHMGVIVHRGGRPYVFEAVATVRFTPLDRWIARGSGGHFVVKRLKDADRLLTPAFRKAFKREAQRLAGRPYDLTFEWSDERIYCSELVWKLYDAAGGVHVGELQRLRSFELSDPVVRAKMRERYGADVPLDEPVISPSEMFASALLETVAED